MNKYCISLVALFLTACGGGGGNSPSPAPTVTVTSSSQTATLCANPHNATYPDTYIGNYTVPNPSGKLPNDIQRSVGFKDYHVGNDYKLSQTCGQSNEYSKRMYEITLDKLKEINAEYIWIYQYGTWKNLTDDVWTVDRLQIPEDMVTFIVTEARKRNIKVYFAWQFHPYDINNNSVFTGEKLVSLDMLKKVMATHKANMIYWAKYNQANNVSGMAVDMATFFFNLNQSAEVKKYYEEQMSIIIDEIRKVYSGTLVYGTSEMMYDYFPLIYNKVDLLIVNVLMPTKNHGDMFDKPMSVELIKKWVSCNIENRYQKLQGRQTLGDNFCYNYKPGTRFADEKKLPPVMLDLTIQSRDKYFAEGWVEDGFCVSGKNSDGSTNTCIQETYKADFSVQAIGIEGSLQAIVEQKFFTLKGVNFSTSYWLTDTLLASGTSEGFPNLSQSFRGKPAEKIVKQWYSR